MPQTDPNQKLLQNHENDDGIDNGLLVDKQIAINGELNESQSSSSSQSQNESEDELEMFKGRERGQSANRKGCCRNFYIFELFALYDNKFLLALGL